MNERPARRTQSACREDRLLQRGPIADPSGGGHASWTVRPPPDACRRYADRRGRPWTASSSTPARRSSSSSATCSSATCSREPEYRSEERAEEGFEKRLTLEFLLWFLGEALPADFSFPYVRRELEEEYPEALARRIAEGRGWAARLMRAAESSEKIVLGDFKNRR